MKKRALSVLCAVLCMLLLLPLIPSADADTHYLDINATNFPDANFRQWIIDNLKHSGTKSAGYYMTKSQVNAVESIDCELCNISSVKGIEKFPELVSLCCGGNNISSLDVSKNLKLNDLMCGCVWEEESDTIVKNKLTKLDVSKNTNLEWLECAGCKLTTLDVSKNTKLVGLYCSDNQLTSLDVSNNTLLEFFACEDNQITTLDVSKNSKLNYLCCIGNGMTKLTLGSKPKLDDLSCWDNSLTSLDVSKAPELQELRCDNNKLTALDVSKNTKLTVLFCTDNRLTSLDVSKNTLLTDFYCERNRLSSLDLSKNTKLKYFDFNSQQPTAKKGAVYSGTYQFDLKTLVPMELMANVTIESEATLNTKTGIVTFPGKVTTFTYQINPKAPRDEWMDVTFSLSYETQTKPSITTQPAAKSVASGKTATFTVAASGGALTYQWQYSKNNGSTWANWSGKTSATISFKGSETNNGYLYRCVVKNLAGSTTTSSAKLTVTGVKPKIITQPAAKTVAKGNTATFKVVAAGSGLTYQWYYSKNNGSTWTSWNGKTSATLSFNGSEVNNGYLYRCVVKNSYGSVTSSSARLTVTGVKPKILTNPASKTVASGTSVTMKVVAGGSGLSYQWQYSKNNGSTWTNWSGKTTSSITFKASSINNGYQYRCRVKNSYGTVYSSAATLRLK